MNEKWTFTRRILNNWYFGNRIERRIKNNWNNANSNSPFPKSRLLLNFCSVIFADILVLVFSLQFDDKAFTDRLRPPVRSSISVHEWGRHVEWTDERCAEAWWDFFVTILLNCNFSLFSPDRSMVDDTSTIADIQHDLSFTLQNYMLSDNFPAHRPRVTFHVSNHWFIGIHWNSLT